MSLPRFTTLLKWGVVALLILAGVAVWMLPRRTGIPGFMTRATPVAMVSPTDAGLRQAFANADPGLPAQAYDQLFQYAFEGFLTYRTSAGALANYPGRPSSNGRRADGIEGFARMLPVAGAWLESGRPDVIESAGKKHSLSAIFIQGLLAGTDPASPEYWGAITDTDQRIVESSDIGLGLWLSRDFIWAKLGDAQRKQVAAWLGRAIEVETYDGNWELFPLVAHHALTALGVDTSASTERARTRYEHFKSFYRGDGWFFDPPNGFDYYNAWSIHYQLFWLDQMAPSLDPQFIRKVSGEFTGFYKHLFGPKAYPMMGRSACYRMAAPTPLVTATFLAPQVVSPGQAMRALDLSWSYFVKRGAMQDGAITQGFCGTNPELIYAYTGPASCLWAMRSVIAAYHLDARVGLLQARREKLPVEIADFEVTSATPGWKLTGDHATSNVTITMLGNAQDANPPLKQMGLPRRAMQWVLEKPMPPENHAALYQRRTYSTAQQPVACQAD